MPLQATSGAASYDAFGGGVPVEPNYIESVFSTYLYTGNGSAQTITNGLDLSAKGGLVWTKARNVAESNVLTDSVTGQDGYLFSDSAATQGINSSIGLTFQSTGYYIGNSWSLRNGSTNTYVSWTMRKQPKFFDVVTYTGNSSTQNISHNLGSVPGCIIVKRLTTADSNWQVYHNSLANTEFLNLNTTAAKATSATKWNSTTPTSTVFSIGADSTVNASSNTYVAYLFAHDAGGFGLTGTDNVISCGSYTGTSTTDLAVNLGYEPQWIMVKRTNSSASPGWWMGDIMRGFNMSGIARLEAQASDAESGLYDGIRPTSTGFVLPAGTVLNDSTSSTYIYIAIRRGPMKVPTDGTSVFSPNVFAAAAGTQINTGFPVDMQFQFYRDGGFSLKAIDRLRGVNSTTGTVSTPWLATANTAGEANGANTLSWNNTGFQMPTDWQYNLMSFNNFRRAPSFFDEVCFTQASGTQNHNLGVAPELVILKSRSTADAWYVFAAQSGFGEINRTVAWAGLGNGSGLGVNLANVTSTTLSKFGAFGTGNTAVAYMFATLAGVSKVGSYTGNGSTQTINCGFTAGARFVLIKRTDSTGDWYVYDTARGMTTLTDPYLLLNSTAAEVATLGSVTTVSTGFALNSSILAAINVSGGTYIFLAIA